MKQVRQFSMALVVTLMLTLPAIAGQIGIPEPPPPPASPMTAAPGEIPIGVAGATHGPGMSSSLTDVGLSLMQTVLLVF